MAWTQRCGDMAANLIGWYIVHAMKIHIIYSCSTHICVYNIYIYMCAYIILCIFYNHWECILILVRKFDLGVSQIDPPVIAIAFTGILFSNKAIWRNSPRIHQAEQTCLEFQLNSYSPGKTTILDFGTIPPTTPLLRGQQVSLTSFSEIYVPLCQTCHPEKL